MNVPLLQRSQSLGGFLPNTSWGEGADQQDTLLSGLEGFLSMLIGLMTVVASIYFIFNFLLAAVSWVTAGGDAGKIQSARDRIIQSTIGLVIVVAAYGVIGLIGTVLGIEILQPAEQILTIIS